MTASSQPLIHRRLAQLAAHLLVAVIALVAIGGATRVMEAGLACPDWPLCFGSFFPERHMNLKVFLEWFHRFDAFIIGIFALVQFGLAFLWRSQLPRWLPWANGLIVILIALQGALGALTVLQLLPSLVVTAHLVLALTLVALVSAITERLQSPNGLLPPLWWRFFSGGALLSVFGQSILGARMATSWSVQRCANQGHNCQWLDWHKGFALAVVSLVFIFILIAIFSGGWARSQWPSFLVVVALLSTQIALGILSLHFSLSQPVITVAHQLLAALLVAFLASLSCRGPNLLPSRLVLLSKESVLESCHG